MYQHVPDIRGSGLPSSGVHRPQGGVGIVVNMLALMLTRVDQVCRSCQASPGTVVALITWTEPYGAAVSNPVSANGAGVSPKGPLAASHCMVVVRKPGQGALRDVQGDAPPQRTPNNKAAHDPP